MHEYAIMHALVESLIGALTAPAHLSDQHGQVDPLCQYNLWQVAEVRLRRSSALSDDALEQAFAMAVADTPLANARLTVETEQVNFHCSCGYQQVITSDDLIGHMFVCPACGTVAEVAAAHELTLLGIMFESSEAQDVQEAQNNQADQAANQANPKGDSDAGKATSAVYVPFVHSH